MTSLSQPLYFPKHEIFANPPQKNDFSNFFRYGSAIPLGRFDAYGYKARVHRGFRPSAAIRPFLRGME